MRGCWGLGWVHVSWQRRTFPAAVEASASAASASAASSASAEAEDAGLPLRRREPTTLGCSSSSTSGISQSRWYISSCCEVRREVKGAGGAGGAGCAGGGQVSNDVRGKRTPGNYYKTTRKSRQPVPPHALFTHLLRSSRSIPECWGAKRSRPGIHSVG